MAHQLALWTWQQTAAYLERSRLVLVPVGSTEQHGPNGLLGTDAVCAEAIALGVAARVEAPVAPTIAVGMSLHHLGFAGTISLRPTTLIAVVTDYVTSLYRHGFRGFLFVNGHGGNLAGGRAALQGLREEAPEARMRWVDWWHVPAVEQLADRLFGDRRGSHASPAEISVTMAHLPGTVEPIAGPLDMASCRPRGIPGSERFRRFYPDGRIGADPSLASPQHGEALVAAAVEAIAAEAVDLLAELAAG